MSVKKIDPVTHDLVREGSFVRVSGAEEIAQGVDVRLQILAGEYPWDLLLGTGWLDLVFVKGTPVGLILGEIERRILEQPGMLSVLELDATRTADRSIRVDWEGTASVSTLNEILRVRGTTEVNT